MGTNIAFERIEEEREKTSFFKILVSADLLSETMRLIPYKFKMSESKNVPLKVILKVVWGRSWTVNLSEFIGLYLMEKKGWEKFLKENRLGDDEFLTFTDVGNNCLAVNIYEKNGRESLKPREATFIAASSSNVKKEEMSSVGPVIGRGTKREKEKAVEEDERKKRKKMKRRDNVKKEEMSCVGPMIAEPSRRTKQKKKRLEEEDKRKRVDANANGASSSRSAASFDISIKPSSLLVLTVPTCFAKKHMPKETTDFLIHGTEGKSWEVTYDYSCNRQKLFSCGWRILARDCSLTVGDFCRLTLIKPSEMVLDVKRKCQSP